MAELHAYSFTSRQRLDEMRERLNADGSWAWRDGDSGWLGDYLATRTAPGSLRLYEENGRFVLELRRDFINPAIRAIVVERLLPLLEASDIQPDEGFS